MFLNFYDRELHRTNSDFSIQASHGISHHPGVYTVCIPGHAQLDRVLDEAWWQRQSVDRRYHHYPNYRVLTGLHKRNVAKGTFNLAAFIFLYIWLQLVFRAFGFCNPRRRPLISLPSWVVQPKHRGKEIASKFILLVRKMKYTDSSTLAHRLVTLASVPRGKWI